MFSYAGWLYFSNRENTSQIEKAHKIFTSVFIGFCIAIGGWLIVQTVLKTLAGDNYKSWTTFSCSEKREMNASITQLFQRSGVPSPVVTVGSQNYGGQANYTTGCSQGDALQNGACINAFGGTYSPNTNTAYKAPDSYNQCYGGDQVQDGYCQGADGGYPPFAVNTAQSGPEGSCSGGYKYTEDSQYAWCQGPGGEDDIQYPETAGPAVTRGPRGVAQCSDQNTNCDVQSLQALGLTPAQAQVMSCVAMTENSGQSVGCSGTGPCGTFQISRTDWGRYAPTECSASAFGSITAAQNNADCNKRVAVTMVQQRGFQPWTGNMPGQAPWNPAATQCVNNYNKI